MKRIFSLTLALVLVLTCVVPASAASVPGQYDVVDLLATGFFPRWGIVSFKIGIYLYF